MRLEHDLLEEGFCEGVGSLGCRFKEDTEVEMEIESFCLKKSMIFDCLGCVDV